MLFFVLQFGHMVHHNGFLPLSQETIFAVSERLIHSQFCVKRTSLCKVIQPDVRLKMQRIVTNRLLPGQLPVKHLVTCIPVTINHCRLRRQCSQARAHWRIRKRPVERMQQTCLWLRHTGLTPTGLVWGAIFSDSRFTLVVIPRD